MRTGPRAATSVSERNTTAAAPAAQPVHAPRAQPLSWQQQPPSILMSHKHMINRRLRPSHTGSGASREVTPLMAAAVLGREDRLFQFIAPTGPRRKIPDVLPDPATLGLTEPNAAGNRYPHGTTQGYSSGRCRCQHCRHAYADYRAQRRAEGKDGP